jgi:hypothetical protein
MLDDPKLNFAISAQGRAAGVNHFGMQADSPDELARLKALADAASQGAVSNQGEVTCCYARSNKHWTVDPDGLPWEHFLTLSDAVVFGSKTPSPARACGSSAGADAAAAGQPCCGPQAAQPAA